MKWIGSGHRWIGDTGPEHCKDCGVDYSKDAGKCQGERVGRTAAKVGTVQVIHEDIATCEMYDTTVTLNDDRPGAPTPAGWRPVGPWKPFAAHYDVETPEWFTVWRRKYERWQGGSII
jgi:hypothetical protein